MTGRTDGSRRTPRPAPARRGPLPEWARELEAPGLDEGPAPPGYIPGSRAHRRLAALGYLRRMILALRVSPAGGRAVARCLPRELRPTAWPAAAPTPTTWRMMTIITAVDDAAVRLALSYDPGEPPFGEDLRAWRARLRRDPLTALAGAGEPGAAAARLRAAGLGAGLHPADVFAVALSALAGSRGRHGARPAGGDDADFVRREVARLESAYSPRPAVAPFDPRALAPPGGR